MKTYYNEFDKYPAQWLRNLIAGGLIAPGDVDERSIEDVTPTDLIGYDRCHFFAGIAGWERALQLVGWPAEWPVWTGSCPCQPFSAAGKGGRGADERHLWPAWFHLIRVCRPPIIFGEQVASKDGLKWLDLVCSDLEAEGYAIGAADLCAAGVGAPHIRQRLWFVAHLPGAGQLRTAQPQDDGEDCGKGRRYDPSNGGESPAILMGHAGDQGLQKQLGFRRIPPGEIGSIQREAAKRIGTPDDNFWSSCQWLPCRDGKWRPTGTVKPSDASLVAGFSADLGLVCAEGKYYISPLIQKTFSRIGRLRAYGNSINPYIAAEFIKAVMEAMEGINNA